MKIISFIGAILLAFCVNCFAGTLSGFPSTHPETAVSGIYNWYDEEAEIFIWKEDNEIWIEFLPVLEEVFICSTVFGIIQDDVWYDSVRLETPAGNVICSTINAPYIAKLTQKTSRDGIADLSRPFRFAWEIDLDIDSIPFSPDAAGPAGYAYFVPFFNSNGWSGLALSNIGAEPAEVTAIVYNHSGAALASEAKTITPKGQAPFLMDAILSEDGWVKIASTRELAGMSLGGAGQFVVDIPLTDALSRRLIFPHVRYDAEYDTIVFLANPSTGTATVNMHFVDPNGIIPYGTRTIIIPPMGYSPVLLSETTSGNMIPAGQLKISSNRGLTAFALYHNLNSGGQSLTSINAVDAPE